MTINYDDKSNDPLNQFFGNNNGNARDNDKKDVSELLFPNLPYQMKLNLLEKLIMWLMEIL
jgi:hypothetical protein